VQVVVVGNPANTNAYIAKMYAKGIPPENFTCLTRLDQNRAQSQVSFSARFKSHFTYYELRSMESENRHKRHSPYHTHLTVKTLL